MRQIRIVAILLISVLLTACSTTSNVPKSEAFEGFYEEKPLTVLITTPINKIESDDSKAQDKFYFPVNDPIVNEDNSAIPISHSPKVRAEEYFFSSLSIPFAHRGYSVIAPERTEEILKVENNLDSDSLLEASLDNFREKHGVDMVVFTLIHEWEHNWRQATMDITVEYIIKSTLTEKILYSRKGHVKYDLAPNPRSRELANVEFNLYKEPTVYSFNPSEEKFLEVARACNLFALNDLPYGMYHGNFGTDGNKMAGKKEFKVYLNEYSEI